jgi:hypothetical protein
MIQFKALLPVIMIVLSAAASFVYLLEKDWRHAIYWAASAVIISSVTF